MQFIDLHRQYELIGKKIEKGFKNVLEHKHFIMGEEVKLLEKRLADFVGVKHAICCASGTDALVIPLRAYELTDMDAVFVPSFTFFASAESISLAGGTPVFVDCEYDTYNMSPQSLEREIERVRDEERLVPRGIVVVDLFGLPANHDEIAKIAEKYGLFILEDGAQGFGGSINGRKACSFGDVAATSFFPAKPLGCYGDGGAIFTNNDELAEKIDSIHIHGKGKDKYDNIMLGLNSRLDTLQAVVLNAKLDIFNEELKLRNKIANMYCAILRDVLEVPMVLPEYVSSWAQFTVKLKDDINRENVLQSMNEKGVPTAVYYQTPIHLSSAYKHLKSQNSYLPTTEAICKKVFSIPMHPYITEIEVEQICGAIKEAVK